MSTELRAALRRMGRRPAFSVIAVGTLTLGIGATAACLALVDGVLLQALPYRDPSTLVLVRGEMRRETVQPFPISFLDAAELSKQRSMFTDVAAVTGARPYNLTAGADVEHIAGEMAGASYLRTLGRSLAIGRWYTEEEAAPPGVRVVVVSHDLWERRFGSSRSVIGKTLLLNEQPYQVIGVAARGFTGLSDAAQVWLPLGLSGGMYGSHYTELREFRWLSAVVRLAPGVSELQLKNGLTSLGGRLESAFPKENAKFSFRGQAMTDAYFGPLRRPLYALLAGGVLVLLIACTNVANLMLVRAAATRRETAVRVALGAGARKLVQPIVAEMIVLGVLAAVFGVAIAIVASRLIVASGAIPLQSFVNVHVSPFVIAAALLLSVGCALVCGATPAFSATRAHPAAALGEGGRGAGGGRTTRRIQRALISVEVAVALVLLIGALLVTRGFSRFLRGDIGFRPDSVLSLRLDLVADRYKDNGQYFAFVRAILDQARQVGGVQAVAIEGPGLPTGGWYQIHVTPDAATSATPIATRRHHVSPGYFDALGIKRREGRDFDASDVPGGSGRSIIISRALAQRAFPGETALGKRLLSEGAQPIPLTIVGVVDDVAHGGREVDATAQADVYFCVLQSPARSPAVLTLFVRTGSPAGPLIAALKERVRNIDSNLSFYDKRTMTERLRGQTATGRFLMVLMTVFGAIGLLLAAVGVYGVISYGVTQRTRETGVRMALGADARGVVVRVVLDALVPVGVGAAAGLVGVAALHRYTTSLLYGMSPMDPLTIVVSLVVIGIVAVAASGIPARRAARVDPAIALRAE